MISELYSCSRAVTRPLRIGMLLDSFQLSRAFRQVLTDICSSNFARLELAVVHRQSPAAAAASTSQLGRYVRALFDPKRRRQILYSLYSKFDRRNILEPYALESVDCSDLLA